MFLRCLVSLTVVCQVQRLVSSVDEPPVVNVVLVPALRANVKPAHWSSNVKLYISLLG